MNSYIIEFALSSPYTATLARQTKKSSWKKSNIIKNSLKSSVVSFVFPQTQPTFSRLITKLFELCSQQQHHLKFARVKIIHEKHLLRDLTLVWIIMLHPEVFLWEQNFSGFFINFLFYGFIRQNQYYFGNGKNTIQNCHSNDNKNKINITFYW